MCSPWSRQRVGEGCERDGWQHGHGCRSGSLLLLFCRCRCGSQPPPPAMMALAGEITTSCCLKALCSITRIRNPPRPLDSSRSASPRSWCNPPAWRGRSSVLTSARRCAQSAAKRSIRWHSASGSACCSRRSASMKQRMRHCLRRRPLPTRPNSTRTSAGNGSLPIGMEVSTCYLLLWLLPRRWLLARSLSAAAPAPSILSLLAPMPFPALLRSLRFSRPRQIAQQLRAHSRQRPLHPGWHRQ